MNPNWSTQVGWVVGGEQGEGISRNFKQKRGENRYSEFPGDTEDLPMAPLAHIQIIF
jgi:hypothetical protein